MQLYVDGISDVGQERQQNEDRMQIAVLGDGSQLLVVCDGMGGHEAGNVASEVATRAIVEYVSAQAGSAAPPQLLWDALQGANEAVRGEAQARGIPSMGTTAVVGWVIGDQLWCGWVGDSRLYHYRDGVMQIQTEDHTRVQKMVEMQILSAEEAKNHPEAHVLTQALGGGMDAQASFRPSVWSEPSQVRAGDVILLCSDGLYDLVDDAELYPLIGGMEVLPAVQRLVDTANGRGGHDNVTVIIGSVGSPQLAKGPPPDLRKTMVVTPDTPGQGVLAVPARGDRPTSGLPPQGAPPASVSHPPPATAPPAGPAGGRPVSPPRQGGGRGWIWGILGVGVGVGLTAALVIVILVGIRHCRPPEPPAVVEDDDDGTPGTPPVAAGRDFVVYADLLDPGLVEAMERGELQVAATIEGGSVTVSSPQIRPDFGLHTVLAIDRAGHMEHHWGEANELATRMMDGLPDTQSHEIDLVYFTDELQSQIASRAADPLRAKLAETAATTNVWGTPATSRLQSVLPLLTQRATREERPPGAQVLLFTTPSTALARLTCDKIIEQANELQVSIWPVVFKDAAGPPRVNVMEQFRRLAAATRGRVLLSEDLAARFEDLGKQANVPERLVRVDIVVEGPTLAPWEVAKALNLECTGVAISTTPRVVRVQAPGGPPAAPTAAGEEPTAAAGEPSPPPATTSGATGAFRRWEDRDEPTPAAASTPGTSSGAGAGSTGTAATGSGGSGPAAVTPPPEIRAEEPEEGGEAAPPGETAGGGDEGAGESGPTATGEGESAAAEPGASGEPVEQPPEEAGAGSGGGSSSGGSAKTGDGSGGSGGGAKDKPKRPGGRKKKKGSNP